MASTVGSETVLGSHRPRVGYCSVRLGRVLRGRADAEREADRRSCLRATAVSGCHWFTARVGNLNGNNCVRQCFRAAENEIESTEILLRPSGRMGTGSCTGLLS